MAGRRWRLPWQAEARAAAVEPEATVKTIALHDRNGYRLAVCPDARAPADGPRRAVGDRSAA
jgi:hypothetical protein